jgi:hypothetical protein
MIAARRASLVIASATLALALTVPTRAAAQGNGNGKGHKSTPPSRSVLPSPTAAGATAGGASPLAWIDDASVLAPGTVSVSIFALRWQGADLSEVSVPIVDIVAGLTPRVQLGASIPRVGGTADPAGAGGGVGTSYFSVKIALPTGGTSGFKLAVAPTLEVLGDGARQSLAPGDRRTQLGLPVMAEIERGAARLFGSAGYFSRGAWFAGGGVGAQASPRVAVSAAFSRAWSTDAATALVRDRKEISGGAALSVTPHLSLFGSLGRTVATADSDGAGTTVAAGISLLIGPSTK